MNIIHFEVHDAITHLITGTTFPFPLTVSTFKNVPNSSSISALSCMHHSRVDQKVLDAFPKLQLLITRTVGTDHIDLVECKKRSIAVYHIPDYGSYNIAEHAMALLLAGCRGIVPLNNSTHEGLFSHEVFFSMSVHGKTIGVIGTGKIGLAFVKLLQGFDVIVIAYDVFQNKEAAKKLGFSYVTLDELLKNSDAISIHVPLLPETKYLINNEAISAMKQGVVLVNTSRGAIVDTQALITNSSKFKAICLDVVENEEQFSIDNPLLKLENVIITPHSAFYTDDALVNMARETQNCVEKFTTNDKTGRVV